jgi:hypothetical protein
LISQLYRPSSKIIVAPLSAIIAVGVLVFPAVIVGITDESTKRRPPALDLRQTGEGTNSGAAAEARRAYSIESDVAVGLLHLHRRSGALVP